MKLLVAGSRSFKDSASQSQVEHWLSNASYILDRRVTEVIHGGARGIDTMAGQWAAYRDYTQTVYLPDWDRYGRSAGFRRNAAMVDACDAAIIVWDGQSKGTKHTLELIRASHKPFVLVCP